MTRYNIYYTKYSIMANDYIPYIQVVYTDDIYHEVGKMICTSIEKIDSIRYTQPRASEEDCEKFFIESGYVKVGYTHGRNTLWRLEKTSTELRRILENPIMTKER